MRRELGDERERYGRKGLREQLDDAIAWPGNQRFATGVILVVVAGALLLTAGAEGAACTASHGHEVAAIVVTSEPNRATGETGLLLARDAIRRQAQPLCEAAFEAYLGHALAGSRFVTFPVAPEPKVWVDGGRQTVCLVARRDGQWLDQPARGSGE